MKTPTAQQVLDCPMGENDAEAKTIRDYLSKLLSLVWQEEEGFDGKRPFGNSSWQLEVYAALAENALIEATKDEWNDWNYRDADANALVQTAILGLAGEASEYDCVACGGFPV